MTNKVLLLAALDWARPRVSQLTPRQSAAPRRRGRSRATRACPRWSVVDTPDFRVLRDYAEPGATRRMHQHADATYHVFTLVTGQLTLTVEGEMPQEVTQGQVLSIKGGAMHTFTNTGKVTATIVEVFGKAKK